MLPTYPTTTVPRFPSRSPIHRSVFVLVSPCLPACLPPSWLVELHWLFRLDCACPTTFPLAALCPAAVAVKISRAATPRRKPGRTSEAIDSPDQSCHRSCRHQSPGSQMLQAVIVTISAAAKTRSNGRFSPPHASLPPLPPPIAYLHRVQEARETSRWDRGRWLAPRAESAQQEVGACQESFSSNWCRM